MKKAKFLIILLLIPIVFFSCRMTSDLDYTQAYEVPTTWASLFDIFWKKMNTNYVFWSLDYNEGTEWDDVYSTYMPQFETLGDIESEARTAEEQRNNSLEAFQLFLDITKVLHDGHLAIRMSDSANGDGNKMGLSPSGYRQLKEMGYTEDVIFEFFSASTIDERQEICPEYYEAQEENTKGVIEHIFGISSPETNTGNITVSSNAAAYGYGFERATVGYVADTVLGEPLYAICAKTSDGIVYLSFNEFAITSSLEGENSIKDVISTFFDEIFKSDTSGVIIDLRGNGGGAVIDLTTLWSAFLAGNEDSIHPADTRRKDGDNRTDYGPWVPFEIGARPEVFGSATFNKNIPIAVLHNRNSVSCAEMSTMIMHCLKDYHGYTVRTFGSYTAGGNGMLNGTSEGSEYEYNAGTTRIDPYVSLLYTPYLQLKYCNGTIYEGVGIAPDEEILFNYNNFCSGNDERLATAISWIRGN